MPRQVERLMVLRAGEGAQAGGDGVVRTWFDFDVVGRIGVDQMNHRAVE
jgi:hypothetical protein